MPGLLAQQLVFLLFLQVLAFLQETLILSRLSDHLSQMSLILSSEPTQIYKKRGEYNATLQKAPFKGIIESKEFDLGAISLEFK